MNSQYLDKVKEAYHDFLDGGDKRVENWYFMRKPDLTYVIFLAYLFFVWYGPKYMKNRQPYKLKSVLMVYNAFQVCFSFYMFKEFLVTSYQGSYSYICQPIDRSDDELAIRMASAVWLYFVSKFVDLFDTVFFILRKKNSQVTFLHVYHHSFMALAWWFATKYGAGGHVFFTCMANSLVHTIMYAYYGLSSLGPKVQKYLWWKKYLTQMQLIQFVMIIAHISIGFYQDCSYPRVLGYISLTYVISLVVLFTNFYIHSYVKKAMGKGDQRQAVQDSLSNNNNDIDKVLHSKKKGSDKVGFVLRKRSNGYPDMNGGCLLSRNCVDILKECAGDRVQFGRAPEGKSSGENCAIM